LAVSLPRIIVAKNEVFEGFTRGHVRYTSANISDMVRDSDIVTVYD